MQAVGINTGSAVIFRLQQFDPFKMVTMPNLNPL